MRDAHPPLPKAYRLEATCADITDRLHMMRQAGQAAIAGMKGYAPDRQGLAKIAAQLSGAAITATPGGETGDG